MNIQNVKPILVTALVVIGNTLSLPLMAQSDEPRPLEEIGVVRAVDPARSMITVDHRKLQLTTATQISADDPKLPYSGISKSWLGHRVAMQTDTTPNGTITVLKLHLFRNTD